MRQLAVAGSILLACLLGLAPSAHARNRYAADQISVSAEQMQPQPRWPEVVNARHSAAPSTRYAHVTDTIEVDFAPVGRPMSILPAHASMANLVLAAARRHGVPAALAYGVASVESGFNPRARSRSGAVGLMQIMPATARGLGCRGSLSNPAVNADCGARYLAAILGDHGGNMRLAAAMYNQGRFAARMTRGGARYAALVMQHGRRLPG